MARMRHKPGQKCTGGTSFHKTHSPVLRPGVITLELSLETKPLQLDLKKKNKEQNNIYSAVIFCGIFGR